MERTGGGTRSKSHGLCFCRWRTRPPLRLRPKFQVCTRPSMDFWPFVYVGWQRKGRGGLRSKRRGGRGSEAKGSAAAATSGSGPRPGGEQRKTSCSVEARPRRRTAARAGASAAGRRDRESRWQQTPGQTDQSEGSPGLKGANVTRGLAMQRSQFRGESRPARHMARSSFHRPSLFQHCGKLTARL